MHRVLTELENFQQNCHYYKKGTVLFSFLFYFSNCVCMDENTTKNAKKKKVTYSLLRHENCVYYSL